MEELSLHLPEPGRFTRARTSARWLVRRVVRRPFRHPADIPLHLQVFAAFSGLAALAVLGSVATSGVQHWPAILLLAALACFGETVRVPFADNVRMSFSEVFYLLGCVALSPGDAASMLLLTIGVGMLFATPTWQGSLFFVAQFGTGAAAALGAATGVEALLGGGGLVGDAAALAAAYLAVIFMNGVMLTVLLYLESPRGSRGLGRLVACYRQENNFTDPETLVQMGAQAPLSLLGLIAFSVQPWSVAILLVPFVTAWRTAVQASRLLKVEKQAREDQLTGLPNRRSLFEVAEQELEAARKYHHGLWLVMGDLDNFKQINDTRGHMAGDAALTLTATILKQVAEEEELSVGRYGGEEFAILIATRDRHEVARIAERIRHEVEKALAQWNSSISLGIAFAEPDDRFEGLVVKADEALYAAKDAGKNQVRFWTPDGDARWLQAV